ncbi:stage VI sporulation protein D [Fredinandcohnia humi]
MTSENLRFSVEESVWFQKGQEVSELLSISLDPDIVIQEHDQYVSIRGALQLTGEYRIDENTTEEEERDFTSVRLINEVIIREDGIYELNHRFPVDITIPQNRVQSLDEVYVSIEAFDYELPKRGCLKIIADLSISGIHGVSQAPKAEKVEEAVRQENAFSEQDAAPQEETVNPVQESTNIEQALSEIEPITTEETQVVTNEVVEEDLELVRSSSFDDDEVVEVEHVEHETDQEEVVLQSAKEVVLHTEEEHNGDSIVVSEDSHDETDDDLFVPFEVEARKEAYHEPEEQEELIQVVQEEVKSILSPQIEVKARHDNKLSFGSDEQRNESITAVEDKLESETQVEEKNQSGKRSENELLLTRIFGRDEVEEHTTMKICIVQNGDSLDKIAERYEISVQQLVRVNSLNTDSVSEGQLLYIPVQLNN